MPAADCGNFLVIGARCSTRFAENQSRTQAFERATQQVICIGRVRGSGLSVASIAWRAYLRKFLLHLEAIPPDLILHRVDHAEKLDRIVRASVACNLTMNQL